MIIDFSVENFRSFKEEQTLSMVAAKHKEHPDNVFESSHEKDIRLLKAALIYGANASGKSNFFKALKIFRNFVMDSTDLKLDQKIPYYMPYKLDIAWADKPTKFMIEFFDKNQIRYKYGMVFNQIEVLQEELVFYPKKQEARLFLRENGKIKFGDSLKGKKHNIFSELLPNQLFLSKAANSNHEQLKEIYRYFYLSFFFISKEDTSFETQGYITSRFLHNQKDKSYNAAVIKLLLEADTGIIDIDIKEKFEKMDFPEHISDSDNQKLKCVAFHDLYDNTKVVGRQPFEMEEESGGTQKMYDLAGKLILTLKGGLILWIDELDSSFHPMMSQQIIRLFNDPEINTKNAQLIATTHDPTLLDQDMLRRDQIWFTEKNSYGATQLYSLAEFDTSKVRKDSPFAKWYLTGRFGAVPAMGNLFEPVESE